MSAILKLLLRPEIESWNDVEMREERNFSLGGYVIVRERMQVAQIP